MPTLRSPIGRLFQYARHRRNAIAIATTCSVLNKLFDLAPPVLIGAAVDVVVEQEDSFLAGFGIESVDTQILWLALATLLIWGLESVFEYAFALAWRNLAQALQHELRRDAYEHVQRLELSYFEDRSTGGLLTILAEDVNQLERFLDDGANQIIQLTTTVLVVGALFIAAVPSIAPLAIAPTPLVIAGSLWFQKRLAPRYEVVRAKAAELAGSLTNKLSGIATIKAFVAEETEAAHLEEASHAYRRANGDAIRLSSAFVPLIRMGIVLGFTATLVMGAHMAVDGTLNVGLYSVLVFMTQRLLWPLTRLGTILDQYQRAMASTRRILDLLDTPLGLEDGTTALPKVEGDVAFEAVSFSYGRGSSTRSTSAYLRARVRHSSGPPVRGSPRSSSCCSASMTRPRAGSPSMATTSGTSQWPTFDEVSVSSAKTYSCFTAAFATTSPTEFPTRRMLTCGAPPAWPRPMPSSKSCPTGTRHSSANEDKSSRVVSDSAFLSRERSSSTPPSSFSTRLRPQSTTRPKPPFSVRWIASPATAPPSSSPTVCRPFATSTART